MNVTNSKWDEWFERTNTVEEWVKRNNEGNILEFYFDISIWEGGEIKKNVRAIWNFILMFYFEAIKFKKYFFCFLIELVVVVFLTI